ncbi:MAG: ABC transporter ATP-binding protein [Candidatus Dormibacteraceae bacterium]
MAQPLLEVRDLHTVFATKNGNVKAVDGVTFEINPGETLGIVGESGSGKSVTALSVMRLQRPGKILSGEVLFQGRNLTEVSEAEMREIRGQDIAMIFQDPMTSMNPVFRTGWQVGEPVRLHHGWDKAKAMAVAVSMLGKVGIPTPETRARDYPHQFSGGMRQRAMIAMGLTTTPKVLIADEPTTALDVTVQAQILDLLQELQRDFGSAIIIITHDLGVVAEMADDILVMYGGRCVEYAAGHEVLMHPEMPYTWGLLNSVPDLAGDPEERLNPIPGTPPSLLAPPPGCPFEPRCGFSHVVPGELCGRELPVLEPGARGPDHLKRCHLADAEEVVRNETPKYPADLPDLVHATETGADGAGRVDDD